MKYKFSGKRKHFFFNFYNSFLGWILLNSCEQRDGRLLFIPPLCALQILKLMARMLVRGKYWNNTKRIMSELRFILSTILKHLGKTYRGKVSILHDNIHNKNDIFCWCCCTEEHRKHQNCVENTCFFPAFPFGWDQMDSQRNIISPPEAPDTELFHSYLWLVQKTLWLCRGGILALCQSYFTCERIWPLIAC